MTSSLLNISVNRNQYDTPPPHHITTVPAQPWSTYLTNWTSSTQNEQRSKKVRSRNTSQEREIGGSGNTSRASTTSVGSTSQYGGSNRQRIGFQNPWPSWYKPTRKQVWDALEWGEDQDPCIQLAASRVRSGTKESLKSSKSEGSLSSSISSARRSKSAGSEPPKTRAQLAAELLRVQQPDFTFDPSQHRAKTTWLGHAGILVQLAPLSPGGRAIRCVFDPIFSTRSSPSQVAGPIRSYPSPCTLESLPPIDIYMLSHNHHDHLDFDTVVGLWKCNKEYIRFLVPLGNKAWFVECGIDEQRVIELDWWESVTFSSTSSSSEPSSLVVTCTPSQHNSGRTGFDANESLWASWYLCHHSGSPKPDYRVYFAGDTGFQFHATPGWPPTPSLTEDGRLEIDTSDKQQQAYEEKNPYPSCPAFQEIAARLGSPDLSYFPVSVGATFSFLRSYIPLPDSVSPVPRHGLGLTGANHMPPWDAVKVFKLMTDDNPSSVAVAMHWGTFVPERSEVLKILGQLEFACEAQGVGFARSLQQEDGRDGKGATGAGEEKKKGDGEGEGQRVFLALNHGQSVLT